MKLVVIGWPSHARRVISCLIRLCLISGLTTFKMFVSMFECDWGLSWSNPEELCEIACPGKAATYSRQSFVCYLTYFFWCAS